MAEIHWVVATIIVRADANDHLFEYSDLIDSFKNLDNESIKYILLEYYQNTKIVYVKEFNHKVNAFEEKSKTTTEVFYSGDDIRNFLKQHVLQPDASCKYMLITWGHGAGLGFFTKEIKSGALTGLEGFSDQKKRKAIDTVQEINNFSNLYNLLQANNIIKEDKKPDPEKFFEIKFTDAEDRFLFNWLKENGYIPKYDLISSEVFGNLLRNCFGEIKIDILLTINCYMQTFETGFGLQRNVEYLVSSQTGCLFAGIHYAELFKFFNTSQSTAAINSLQVIDNIKQFYPVKYEGFERRQVPCYSTITQGFNFNQYQIAANKLSVYNNLKDIINNIVNHFYQNAALNRALLRIIKIARPYCLDMTPKATYGIIDFLLFLQLYTEFNSTDTVIRGYFNDINELMLDDSLVNVYRSNELDRGERVVSDPHHLYFRKPQYFSVFFPNKKGTATSFIQQFMNANYSTGSTSTAVYISVLKWDDFIRDYYALV